MTLSIREETVESLLYDRDAGDIERMIQSDQIISLKEYPGTGYIIGAILPAKALRHLIKPEFLIFFDLPEE